MQTSEARKRHEAQNTNPYAIGDLVQYVVYGTTQVNIDGLEEPTRELRYGTITEVIPTNYRVKCHDGGERYMKAHHFVSVYRKVELAP
jgi:hypothetical protein